MEDQGQTDRRTILADHNLLALAFSPWRSIIMTHTQATRSSAIAEGPRDASCQLKSCQLPRNSAETTYTTCPDQVDGMKLEI